jgi:hypothetical protein
MELNPEVDLDIDMDNLTSEFKRLSLVLYRYSKYRAQVDAKRDVAKARLKEIKAHSYKRIKSDTSVKHTEKSMEAEIDTDPVVIEAQMALIKAEHDASTWGGAVDSMKAKKDCLIQLGSDRRKEIG